VKTITAPALRGFPPGVPLPGLPAGAAWASSQLFKASGGNGSVILRVRDGKAVPAKLMPATVPLPAGAWKGIACARSPRIPATVLKQIIAQLPTAMPEAQRAALQKKLAAGAPGACAAIRVLPAGRCLGISPSSVSVPPGVLAAAAPRVLGHDWLSVLVLPAAGLSASGLPAGLPPGVGVPGLGGALLSVARPVHGSWGSGRLLRTSLISVLITDSGQVLIGAVQPSVLYADAAQLG
jgi:hypothetical protein